MVTINDINISSHIVSNKELTLEEIKGLEQIIEKDETLNDVSKFLEEKGHEIVHTHINDLEVNSISVKRFAEGKDFDEVFNEAVDELNNMFKDQSGQQPNSQQV